MRHPAGVLSDQYPGSIKMQYARLKYRSFWRMPETAYTTEGGDLPEAADIVVCGSGFTGLSAALSLCEAGRDVCLIEAEEFGHGASTRNAGMVGDRLKGGFGELSRRFGEKGARAMLEEARASVDFVEELTRRHGIDCDFRRMGRFYPAFRPAHFEAQARALEEMKKHFAIDAEMVPPSRMSDYLVSPLYHGGWVHHDTGGLHPGRFHQGLFSAARKAGMKAYARTRLVGWRRRGDGISVRTSRGDIRCRELVMATNGYGVRHLPGFARRVIPIKSFVIATAAMAPERLQALMPGGRMMADSRAMLRYFRISPDGTRLILGGRTRAFEDDLSTSAMVLRRAMVEIFPDLADVPVEYVWGGYVAYAMDSMPHIGRLNGVWHAMAYTGSGVAMAPWLGHKLALKILGREEDGRTAFDRLTMRPVPFYHGDPWYLPAVAAWYRLRDILV